jgi:DNA-directed RNA polymerase subunit L
MYIFLLKDKTVKYVFYDIKEALEKGILLGLYVIRIRVSDGGMAREMLIYSPPVSIAS